MGFSIESIYEAEKRIRSYITETPIIRLPQLDSVLGCKVYIKAECMQLTGSFKIRGATNALLSIGKEKVSRGIVTASSGNHGRGCAFAARKAGIKATVVIPDTAPEIKIEAIKNLGAEIILCPVEERFRIAERISKETDAVLVPPYDDEAVMAGQGTLGLEISKQLPDADFVITPLSGGGLLSGVSKAIKSTLPQCKVIGAEPLEIPRYTESLKSGKPIDVPQKKTIADALVSTHPGKLCFPVIKENVDEVVTASEEAIKNAQKLLLLEGKIFAEPSGCLGIAAALEKKIKFQNDSKVCFVVSGGNCSLEQIIDFKS